MTSYETTNDQQLPKKYESSIKPSIEMLFWELEAGFPFKPVGHVLTEDLTIRLPLNIESSAMKTQSIREIETFAKGYEGASILYIFEADVAFEEKGTDGSEIHNFDESNAEPSGVEPCLCLLLKTPEGTWVEHIPLDSSGQLVGKNSYSTLKFLELSDLAGVFVESAELVPTQGGAHRTIH